MLFVAQLSRRACWGKPRGASGPVRFGIPSRDAALIWPGILVGCIFAFILSFGELNAATCPGISTLPIEIFDYLQFSLGQFVIAAASALRTDSSCSPSP